MALTPAQGALTEVEERMAVMLAACASFQAWVGAADSTAARASIYFDAIPPPAGSDYTRAELDGYRPWAIISTLDYSSSHVATGDAHEFLESGSIEIKFADNVDASIANDTAEIGRRFQNNVGQVIRDLKALAGQAGYLAIESISVTAPWARIDEKDIETAGDFVQMAVQIAWGSEE